MATNPFANLPAVSFADTDVNALITAIVQGFETAWNQQTGETIVLAPSDRRYAFLLSLTAFFVSAFTQIDIAAKQNTLPFAVGGFLDLLAAFYGDRANRIGGNPATVTLQFSIPTALGSNVDIPEGTQVSSSSSNGNLIFETTADATITTGNVAVDVAAECTLSGSIGNGLAINTLTTLLDWNSPYVVSVTNTDISGVAPETVGLDAEVDTPYRNRLVYVTDSFSTCGPKKAYQFWALSADETISQVSVAGPEDNIPGYGPGNVLITALGDNGAAPTSTAIANVYSTCNDDNRRDLCAYLTVAAPSGIAFQTSVSYYIPQSQINNVSAIQDNVNNAVTNTILDWTYNLATNIDPSALEAAVYNAGGIRVLVSEPVYTTVALNQVAVLTDDPVVSYLGLS